MNYMVCIPSPDMVSRENCEKVHNILARMSDAYKLNIVPEPVKVRQAPCPEYYRKYRIYKEIRERDGNGEAYLLQEEEEMILSVCRSPEEEALMKGCTYAYRYPSSLVLKSFREEKKEKKEKREARPEPRSERSRGEKTERPERGERPERPGKPERAPRGERQLRGDRQGQAEKAERSEHTEKAERPERPEKPERRDKTERSERHEKTNRGGNSDAGI
ncbi:MAG: hypothetical protein ACOX8F_07405 [Sakamotonia sp.]